MQTEIRNYLVVTGNYWAFTLTDGALRMLVVLHFHQLGYSPLQVAMLFLFYEFFGIVTNLVGGWLGSRIGLNVTMQLGVALQILALLMLTRESAALTVPWVMTAQAISGIAKDLNKMSAKASVKLMTNENASSQLFHWVAILTGSKNSLKGIGFFLGGLLLTLIGFQNAMFFMAANQQPPSLEYVSYETAVAERRNVALDDGSTVMLNADTRLLAAFSDSERRLSLRHGEIFVDVVADASRPFHVEVGGHIVTVTGTAFNVRFRDEPARVTVDEGSVGVVESKAGAVPMQLEAGQQLILEPDATPVTLSPSDLRNSSTWRDGWLHFDDQSLDVVVRELNLYVDTRIILASRQAGELRVTGSFNVDNSDALLTALESVLPVTVSERNQHIVIDFDAR